jgi:hypothetical protein
MKRFVRANTDNIKEFRGACYIDNWSPYNRTLNVLENILKMANRCLAGSGLEVPDIDSIGVADNGQLLGFYNLYKTMSGNSYSIGWHPGGWKLFIYDELDANTLSVLAEVMADFNETFNGVKFHEDRPII